MTEQELAEYRRLRAEAQRTSYDYDAVLREVKLRNVTMSPLESRKNIRQFNQHVRTIERAAKKSWAAYEKFCKSHDIILGTIL